MLVALGYVLALCIGITLGLLGGGGAILTVPVLVYLFQVGVKQAVPMSLAVVGLTSLLGVFRHRRAGYVNFGAAFAFGPPAMLGSALGSEAALRVSGRLQLTVFAIVLLAAATLMLRGPHLPEAGGRRRPLWALMAIGLVVGFLIGFLGVGGGFMYVPALTLLAGLDMKTSVGTSLVLITLSCAAGIAGYLGRVPIDWGLVAAITALAYLGLLASALLLPRVPAQSLRRGFAVFLLAVGVFVLIRGEVERRGAAAEPSARAAAAGPVAAPRGGGAPPAPR